MIFHLCDFSQDVPSGVTFPNDLCAIHFNVDLGDRPQGVLVVLGALDDLQVRPFFQYY